MNSTELFARIDKSGARVQTLMSHLSNAGNICADFCFEYPKIAYLLGFIHDLGKATQAFQDKLNSKTGRVDHSSAGAIYLMKKAQELRALMQESQDKNEQHRLSFRYNLLYICAFAVMCHHTGLRDMCNGANNEFNLTLEKLDTDYAKNYAQVLEFGKDFCAKIDEILDSTEFDLECEKAILKIFDFAHEHHLEQEEFRLYGSLFIRYIYSCLIDADRTDAYLFDARRKYKRNATKIAENRKNFRLIAEDLDNFIQNLPQSPLKEIRDDIYKRCIEKANKKENIFQLNVQTGGGKTFSSFRFALERIKLCKAQKIIYVVPYLSIIEQNANAIRERLKNLDLQDMLVESHSNAINFVDTDENTRYFQYEPAFTKWDEPIIFTTMVSFLESVYCDKTQNNRRLHNMENAVIIFDEIQTLPIKCIALFNSLVNFLANFLNCTIVLCTATQPTLDNLQSYRTNDYEKMVCRHLNLLPAEDIISTRYSQLDRTEVVVDDEIRDIDSACKFAKQKFDEFGNLLFIVNTKPCASNIFQKLKNMNFAKCYHLSTNMCPEHRLNKIKEIKEALQNKERVVLISTQLIEAGVDLDFNCVVRTRAGLESIIQASGRCNREGKLIDKNGNKIKGKVFVISLAPDLENLTYLSDIAERRSKFSDIALQYEDLSSNQAVQDYFQSVYGTKGLCKLKYEIDDKNAIDYLSDYRISEYDLPDNFCFDRIQFATVAEHFRVIEEGDTVGVLMPYAGGREFIEKLQNGEVAFDKNMQRYMVNIYRNKLPPNLQQTSGVLYFVGNYDEDLGFMQEPITLEFEGGIL